LSACIDHSQPLVGIGAKVRHDYAAGPVTAVVPRVRLSDTVCTCVTTGA
jgi:hypothetical protein